MGGGSLSLDLVHDPVELVVRLGSACVLAALLGLEREHKERAAGLRTYMMVALAAAAYTILALQVAADSARPQAIVADPVRIVEAVTAGVAFLAAGTIIVRRGAVAGLTTGAGMWLCAAVGLACGAGYLLLAGIATGFGLFVLAVVRLFEIWLPKKDGL